MQHWEHTEIRLDLILTPSLTQYPLGTIDQIILESPVQCPEYSESNDIGPDPSTRPPTVPLPGRPDEGAGSGLVIDQGLFEGAVL